MRKLWKPALLLATVGIMAFGMLSSGAWFTDTATEQAAAINSGTLSIDNGRVVETSLLTIPNMAPGDKTPPVKVIIENNGSIPLAWFGDLIVGGDLDLKGVIYIDSAKMEFLSPLDAKWEPDDIFITDGLGSGDWPTNWTGPDNLATLAVFDGNSSMAPGSGYEFMGALKPGYRYELTLTFGFWTGADNTYQNQGPLNISFKADATQITGPAMAAYHATLSNMLTWMDQQIDKQDLVP